MTRNATNSNRTINIKDFCYKPISDKVCIINFFVDLHF